MNRFIFRCAWCLLLAVSVAHAAYNPALVSADARWVVFADLEGLRASAVGKEIVAVAEKAQVQTTGGQIGVNLPKLFATIGTLTAYGTNLSKDPKDVDGALIAQGTPDLRKIAESILLQGTLAEPKVFSEVNDLGYPAYAISDPKAKDGLNLQLIVAFPPEPIVIVSKSKAQLQKARDVFRGSAPSIAKTPTSPLSRLSSSATNAFLFAGSVVPTEQFFPENAPQTRILQLANSGSIALGERGSHTFAHAELLAASDQAADKLMKILQGMTAMFSLAETNDKQLAEFLNSTSVAREKNTVTLDIAYSSARLTQMMQAVHAQVDMQPQKRQVMITSGTTIAEWGGDAPAGDVTEKLKNVKLVNGAIITLGRALNGGREARFTSIEIVPAEGGAPLTFRPEMMRNIRGTMWQFQFPGADGNYTLKPTFVPDPEGKAKFAVSVRDPKAPESAEPAPAAPAMPAQKWKK